MIKSKKKAKPKKKKYVPPYKKLQNECEELWKRCIELRDGRQCTVQRDFPQIALAHCNVYQADHCFTRGNKLLFLEPANGTMICASCNRAKHFDNKSVKRAVDSIVRDREGDDKWEEMLDIDMRLSVNYNWNKVWWLEEQRDKLKSYLERLEHA